MIVALVLLSLGIADWLTTRAILAKGGSEANPIARWFITKAGFVPFFSAKAALMGLCGYYAPIYISVFVILFYAYVVGSNINVIKSSR